MQLPLYMECMLIRSTLYPHLPIYFFDTNAKGHLHYQKLNMILLGEKELFYLVWQLLIYVMYLAPVLIWVYGFCFVELAFYVRLRKFFYSQIL